jgi:hypothetical protein
MSGAYSTNRRDETCVHYILVGNPEGKSSLGRPRCRWVDNIRRKLR